MRLPLFDALDDLEPTAGPCRHLHDTTSPVHQPSPTGGSCNHDVTCDACGRLVGTESWNLAIGAKAHADRYGVAA